MTTKTFNAKLKELASAFNVSEAQVRKWVAIGVLKYGTHYIDTRSSPNAKNAMLRFNIEACQKVFLTPPEKR